MLGRNCHLSLVECGLADCLQEDCRVEFEQESGVEAGRAGELPGLEGEDRLQLSHKRVFD